MRQGRAPLCQGLFQGLGQIFALVRGQKGADLENLVSGPQFQARAPGLHAIEEDAYPGGLEAPGSIDLTHLVARNVQRGVREGHGLDRLRATAVHPESPIDERDVETKKTKHRPGAHQRESNPCRKAHRANDDHDDQETLRGQRAVRSEDGVEEDAARRVWHGIQGRS